MRNRRDIVRRLGSGASLAALALLSACGGGGVNSTPTPTPTSPTPSTPAPTTPTPSTPAPSTPTPSTPTPTTLSYSAPPLPPDTIGYNDSEFQNSDGPGFHGAPTAWVRGDTGAGETIALVDTGIASAWSEFAGRIDTVNSTGINGNTGYEYDAAGSPESLHGSEVALIAAAANDGKGTVGIAYDSTIMAIRADDPGSCAQDPSKDTCTFGDVAGGIQWAVDHGAAVINLSMGGSAAAGDEITAVQNAAAAGIVVVISAGNDANSDPDAYSASFIDHGANNVIIVGSVGHTGEISSFSNRAGKYYASYLTALGQGLTVYEDGSGYLISGTSFAAPQVSGAVALLKEAFPTLTAAQIVQLLLSTAQDVGNPGTDVTYGHGILDIYEAFQPQGTTSLAGTGTAAIPLTDTIAVASPAMGDALGTASLNTIVLDGYRRAFHYDLVGEMRGATIRPRLRDAVGQPSRSVSLASGKAQMAFSIDASGPDAGPGPASKFMLSQGNGATAKVLAARVAMRLSPASQLAFAYAEGPQGLVTQLQGLDRPAFLIASRAGDDNAMFERSDISLAYRHRYGPWGLTASGAAGIVYSAAPLRLAGDSYARWTRDRVDKFGLALDRRWGELDGVLGLNLVDESRTVLGARFHDALGGGGAKSVFADVSAGWDFGDGWRLGGALRNGWTFADTGNVIRPGSVLVTRAWSLDVERRGVFGRNDRIGFRVAQPLRVESGGLRLDLPVSYSYDTQSPAMAIERLNLVPTGREIIGEIAWHGPLASGNASASLFYRQDPGNYASLPDDKGVVLRWSKGF